VHGTPDAEESAGTRIELVEPVEPAASERHKDESDEVDTAASLIDFQEADDKATADACSLADELEPSARDLDGER
jgi:hypothetical protein